MKHLLILISVLLFSSFIFSSENKEQGNFTYPNGAKYKGELKERIPNGQGTSTFRDGGKYVGEFRDGLLNGQGTSTLFDGRKYVGQFKDGKRWNGIIFDKEGNIIGKWLNGKEQ